MALVIKMDVSIYPCDVRSLRSYAAVLEAKMLTHRSEQVGSGRGAGAMDGMLLDVWWNLLNYYMYDQCLNRASAAYPPVAYTFATPFGVDLQLSGSHRRR